MNKLTPYLGPITLGAGFLGFLLRLWLKLTGIDEKGLFLASHPANALCFILTALVLLMLALAVRPLKPLRSYAKLYPASLPAMAGCFAAAAGTLIYPVMGFLGQRDLLHILALVLGGASCVCLVLLGLCRKAGQRPHYLYHAIFTCYLMIQLVIQYRSWSSEPQLQLYFFPLLASVFLMLTAYHSAILDAQKGSRRWLVFCNRGALFCCFMSLPGQDWLFYLLMGIYCATNLCSLRFRPYQPRYAKEGSV